MNPSMLVVIGVAIATVIWLAEDRGDLQRELSTQQVVVERLQESARLAEQAFAARDAIDQQYTQELSSVEAENDRLRADVDSGNRRLLVKAACPAVPADAGAARVDDGATIELTADARQDYHRLRAQIAADEKKLAGLQDYVRTVCRQQ
jgi:prophage endopeptidase